MFLPKWGPHADQAKKRHSISELQIAYTWLFGYVMPGENDCWRVIGEEITLITSHFGDFIITMYPNKFNDKRTEKIAAHRRRAGKVRDVNSPRKGK